MNGIDLILLGLAILAAITGYRSEAIKRTFGIFGTVIGFFVAGFLYSKLAFLTQSSIIRTVVLVAVLVGMIFLCADLMVVFGKWLREKLPKEVRLSRINNYVSSGVSVIGGLFILLFFSSTFGDVLPRVVRAYLNNSFVITSLAAHMPIPSVINNLASLRQPFSSPTVFAGKETTFKTDGVLTNAYEELDWATENTKASMAEITTWGCGSTSTGSGFVVDSRHVLTNAHVVAGGERVAVRSGDTVHVGSVVWFDPKLDVALLYTQTELKGVPLTIADYSVKAGSIAAGLGYARDVGLSTNDLVVLQELDAVGYDIYRKEQVNRRIYAFRGQIIPGNSGGPLIDASGKVIGIIFGHSTTQNRIGYAITIKQVADLVKKSATLTKAISAGECTP